MARNFGNKKGITFDNLMIIKSKDQPDEGYQVNVSFLTKKDGKPVADLPFIYLINGKPGQIDNPDNFKTNEHGFGSFDLTTELEEIRINVLHKDEKGEKYVSRHAVKKLQEDKKEKTGKIVHSLILTPQISAKYNEAMRELAECTSGTAGYWKRLDGFMKKLSERERTFFITTIAAFKKDEVGKYLQRFIDLEEKTRLVYALSNGLLPGPDIVEVFQNRLEKFTRKYENEALILREFFRSLAPDMSENFMANISNRSENLTYTLFAELAADDDPKTLARNLGLFNPVK